LNTRDLTYIGVFAALWGAVEISLGTYLKTIGFPLSGLVLSPIGLGLALVARRVVGRNGTVLAVAAVVAALKALSFGGLILAPMAAILMQGLLAELATLGPARPPRWRMCLAGGLGVAWNVFHPLLAQGIIAGKGVYQNYLLILDRALEAFGMDRTAALAALGLLILLHGATGAAAGALADVVADNALRRIRPPTTGEGGQDEC